MNGQIRTGCLVPAQVAALQAEAERQAAEVARLHATTPQQLCALRLCLPLDRWNPKKNLTAADGALTLTSQATVLGHLC